MVAFIDKGKPPPRGIVRTRMPGEPDGPESLGSILARLMLAMADRLEVAGDLVWAEKFRAAVAARLIARTAGQ